MDQDVLHITTSDKDDVTIVRLTGELDSMNVGDLTSAFNGILKQNKRLFVLDLSDLEFIDSAGLGGLVAVWERSMERGCFMALGAVSPRVHDVLQITGLHSVLQAYPSIEDAAGAVRAMMDAFPDRA